MLVLTRSPGQVLSLDGGRITVKVVEVDGRQVKIGIDAPRDVDVHRGEVVERDFRERKAMEAEL